MSFVSPELQPITPEEQLKIESFYRSFGTSIYIAHTAACLYTMTNLRVDSKIVNRASMATTVTNQQQTIKYPEIDNNILKDFMNNKYQNHVSVYHRGVPLWLFNSGNNPRRPYKQLKFTLAEKGTGFILWQDRIDACSDFKLYAMRKSDFKIVNFMLYCEKNPSVKENKFERVNELFHAMLITFRASDRKTTVFVKFDLSSETAQLYEYYLNVCRIKNQEIKQRTKSLPAGLGTAQHINNNFNNNKRLKSIDAKKANRQSFYNTNATAASVGIKYKRISKNDISRPRDLKHIINLNPSDRDSFYTLSKLLTPVSSSSMSSSTSQANDLSISSHSLSSSDHSASSSSKRHSIEQRQKLKLSSFSSISLSMTPPFKLIANPIKKTKT